MTLQHRMTESDLGAAMRALAQAEGQRRGLPITGENKPSMLDDVLDLIREHPGQSSAFYAEILCCDYKRISEAILRARRRGWKIARGKADGRATYTITAEPEGAV